MKNITRVLVANRGEIAVRIIRACEALGLETVAAYSEADQESLPVRLASRAVCIGPPKAAQSYLKIPTLITAALGTGCNAIHPGYGFLAEQPELAQACSEHGLIFIGPSPQNLQNMGNKLLARQIVEGLGLPTIPGSPRVGDFQQAAAIAEQIGFPVLIKAAAGGGGRGMVVARTPGDLKELLDSTSAEVKAAFGDGTLYLERYIANARHVEVQVAADQEGKVLHLGERDCSVQRRYQKVIEEAPSPAVSPRLRSEMCTAAVSIAQSIAYRNLGTVEFVLDQDSGNFYFLEMNTRIQVEHPVTEQISGVDLVQAQIRIADGQPLGFEQQDLRLKGHAIECRITAESAQDGFRPSPGLIERWEPPQQEHIRVDSHCYPGYLIPPYYDSLLAKLITWGEDRGQAIARMQYALEDFKVTGVETTIDLLASLIGNSDFAAGAINTRWLENLLGSRKGKAA